MPVRTLTNAFACIKGVCGLLARVAKIPWSSVPVVHLNQPLRMQHLSRELSRSATGPQREGQAALEDITNFASRLEEA